MAVPNSLNLLTGYTWKFAYKFGLTEFFNMIQRIIFELNPDLLMFLPLVISFRGQVEPDSLVLKLKCTVEALRKQSKQRLKDYSLWMK